MAEADDWPDVQLAQAAQAFVGPGPVRTVQPVRGDSLPENRVAQRAQAKLGEAVEIIEADIVTGARELVEKVVSDAVDGAFDPAPHLQIAG
jgi:hypothetical protein